MEAVCEDSAAIVCMAALNDCPILMGGIIEKVKDNAESPELFIGIINGFLRVHCCHLLVCSMNIVL